MTLHDRIMNIPLDLSCPADFKAGVHPDWDEDYASQWISNQWHATNKMKYRNALREAAQLATEADELMTEMAEALSLYVKSGHGMSTDFHQQGDARQAALNALDKYKEQ